MASDVARDKDEAVAKEAEDKRLSELAAKELESLASLSLAASSNGSPSFSGSGGGGDPREMLRLHKIEARKQARRAARLARNASRAAARASHGAAFAAAREARQAEALAAALGPKPLAVGDKVEGRFGGGAEWFPGTVAAVGPAPAPAPDGGAGEAEDAGECRGGGGEVGSAVVDVLYDDGDTEEGLVVGSAVRPWLPEDDEEDGVSEDSDSDGDDDDDEEEDEAGEHAPLALTGDPSSGGGGHLATMAADAGDPAAALVPLSLETEAAAKTAEVLPPTPMQARARALVARLQVIGHIISPTTLDTFFVCRL